MRRYCTFRIRPKLYCLLCVVICDIIIKSCLYYSISLCYDKISWYMCAMGCKQVHKFFKVNKVLLNAINLGFDAFKLSMYAEKCCQTARDLLGRPRFIWIPYFAHSSDRSSTPNNLNIVLAGETTLLFKVNRKFKRMISHYSSYQLTFKFGQHFKISLGYGYIKGSETK